MISFLGEYEVAVDNKGRFLMPSGFRKQLADGDGRFVVNRGFEKCVTIYPIEVWNKLYEKVIRLNDLKPEVRKFKRIFLNGATLVEADTADRLLLPKQLQEHAGVKKDAVICAQGNKLELWDKDTYYKYINDNSEDISGLSELVAGDIGNPFDSE